MIFTNNRLGHNQSVVPARHVKASVNLPLLWTLDQDSPSSAPEWHHDDAFVDHLELVGTKTQGSVGVAPLEKGSKAGGRFSTRKSLG